MVNHTLASADPIAAREVVLAVHDSITQSTRDSYASGVAHFSDWASDRNIDPFPADPIILSAWTIFACVFLSVGTVRKYLSGIRRYQLDVFSIPWAPQGNHVLASVLRACRRRWPAAEKRLKFPISVLVNKLFHSILDFSLHDDRLFFAASTSATAGLWRGGEFLFSKSTSYLQRLLVSNFVFLDDRVDVSINASKTKFWRLDVTTPLFAVDSVVCPVAALQSYMSRSSVTLRASSFMFTRADGSPLTKAWMLERTRSLLKRLNLPHDRVFAASWRTGGAMSLKWAGIHPDVTNVMGRWKSTASLHYFMTANADIEGAAVKAASLSSSAVIASGFSPFLVGEFSAGGVFE